MNTQYSSMFFFIFVAEPIRPEELREGVVNPTCERLYRRWYYAMRRTSRRQEAVINSKETIKMLPRSDTNHQCSPTKKNNSHHKWTSALQYLAWPCLIGIIVNYHLFFFRKICVLGSPMDHVSPTPQWGSQHTYNV